MIQYTRIPVEPDAVEIQADTIQKIHAAIRNNNGTACRISGTNGIRNTGFCIYCDYSRAVLPHPHWVSLSAR